MKDKLTYLGAVHSAYIDELYQQYQSDPESIDFGWRKFFEGFEFNQRDYAQEASFSDAIHKEFKVINLINGYRFRGHLFTKTNPVRARRTYTPTLELANFGLDSGDLDTVFQAGDEIGIGPAKLSDIIDHLTKTYCRSIGIEYMYIRDPKRVNWLRDQIEFKGVPPFSIEQKERLHAILNKAVVFEQYLQKKFVGQKRFSIEGGEVLIPALDALIHQAARTGVKEFVVGMAHRGRLNTLAHIFEKPYDRIFDEFYGKAYDHDDYFDGDVKYHLGFSKKIKVDDSHDVRITLCPNPSHLEAVAPVAEGLSRAKIDHELADESELLPIIIHGDAAIAGQGVAYEVVQMAGLDGYRTGGSIHIVVNNQIGFTTNYIDGRTSTYCTDVGKVTLSPIFHVNADDVEAVTQAIHWAIAYRQKFKKDVFIDLLGYRKYGHNEGDEPKFTQPKLYKSIAKHPDLLSTYTDQLKREGIMDEAFAKKQKQDLEAELDRHFEKSKASDKAIISNFMQSIWGQYGTAQDKDFWSSPDTGYRLTKLKKLTKKIFTLPTESIEHPGQPIQFFRKTKKLMNDRLRMVQENTLDWGTAEFLAYATLLEEGHSVRISGQDVARGTFSHRHALLMAEDTEEAYYPLQHVAPNQGKFSIYNSLLSEYGVLGFEYGYAYGVPEGLTIWEAQFGDFNNGAQIIIDQFISAAMDKWRTPNGIVMLLPHGYEGMGAEHSSGRMERFLQLCADRNMQIVNCTKPANFFHVLRRQLKRNFRIPLVVFTPKKLLRYPKAVSSLADLAEGGFQEVIDDISNQPDDIDTLVFCSGKVYYDVLEEQAKRKKGRNMAIIRMEQLYPLPEKQLQTVIQRYPNAKQHLWLQEEPANMGAWTYLLAHWPFGKISVLSRTGSGAPATGSPEIHQRRQTALMNQLFTYAK